MALHVSSEVGRLRQVIVHRPGLELSRLTPSNAAEMLFDDVLWAQRAREEHDEFVAAMRARGVTVHLFGDLLRHTLADPAARTYVLDRTFDERFYGPMAIDAVRNAFDAMDVDTLEQYLIGGITKRELLERTSQPDSVWFHSLALDDFVLSPLPNHLYTRDTSCWIYGGVSDQRDAQAGQAAGDHSLRGPLPVASDVHRASGSRSGTRAAPRRQRRWRAAT